MRKILLIQFAVVSAMMLTTQTLYSQNVVTVTDCNLNGWVKQVPANTSLAFKNQPSNSILGKGSLEMITIEVQKNVRLRNTNYNNTFLTSITQLGFSSFIDHRENDYDAPFIVLQIDLNGDGTTDNFLEFGPQYQTAPWSTGVASDQGAVVTGTWQTWDVLHGVFWLGPNIDPEHGGAVFNLATYISQHPTARIINDAAIGGGIRLSAGGFAPNFKCYTDNFKIGVNGSTTVYDFEFTTANAGEDENVVYGYGSNCTTLNGVAAGGVAPYTYSWSGGATPNNSSTTVCPNTTTTYTLTITDKNGCTRSDDVTVNVNDVRCGSKMDKVQVNHNGEVICVAKEAVPAHLNHGDVLGSYKTSPAITGTKTSEQNETDGQNNLRLVGYPNPFISSTQLEYILPSEGKAIIKLYNISGKEVATLLNANKKAGHYKLDFSRGNLSAGVYYSRITLTTSTNYFSHTNRILILSR